jgi:hypothetical protein
VCVYKQLAAITNGVGHLVDKVFLFLKRATTAGGFDDREAFV